MRKANGHREVEPGRGDHKVLGVGSQRREGQHGTGEHRASGVGIQCKEGTAQHWGAQHWKETVWHREEGTDDGKLILMKSEKKIWPIMHSRDHDKYL